MKRYGYLGLFVCSYIIVSYAVGEIISVRNSNPRCSALERVPPEFSVLIVSPSSSEHGYIARIVPYASIKKYTKLMPAWSFAIPGDKETELIRYLSQHTNDSHVEYVNPRITSFDVVKLSGGKQQITLKSSDGIERSRYIVDSRSIRPIFFSVDTGKQRDSYYAVGAFLGIFANAIVWLLLFGFIRILRSIRKAS